MDKIFKCRKALKKRESKCHFLTFESRPGKLGISERYIDRTIKIIEKILMKRKENYR